MSTISTDEKCIVCGGVSSVWVIGNEVQGGEIVSIDEGHYCQEHYNDLVRNEIEIPAERLEILK